MEITATSLKYTIVLASIGGAAAGLNLGVMQLTDPQPPEATQIVESAAPVEPAVEDPLQVIVDVPVVVPDSVLEAIPADAPIADSAVAENTSLSAPLPHTVAPAAVAAAAPTTPAPAPTTAEQPKAAPSTTRAEAPATNAKIAVSPDVQTAAVQAAPATASTPPTTAARATTTVATTQTTTRTAESQTTSVATAPEYLYFDFAGIASQIVIAQHPNGALQLWSVTVEPGWSYRVKDAESDEIKIDFRPESDEDEAAWQIRYDEGRLAVEEER